MQEFELLMKSLSDGCKALSQMLETTAEKLNELSKIKPEDKSEEKTTVQTEEKAEKKPVKCAKCAKPAAKSKAKKHTAKKMSATDITLDAINNTKGIIDVDTLSEKTGFTKKKLSDIVYRLKKQGKIKSPKKGFYEKV